MIVALGIVVFAAAWISFPSPLVLPLFSVFAVAAAASFAAIACVTSAAARTERVTYFDIAGALTLIGVCAALLSDPEQALPLFDAQHTRFAGATD